ncbi:MAG: endonuclease [Planctomycetes bacterium]|nr:endonuclease [Planctomycetota bacterium]
MNSAEIDRLLHQTLDDRTIALGEHEPLNAWLVKQARDDKALALMRGRAFALARLKLGDQAVLDWLEDLLQLTTRQDDAQPQFEAKAFFSPGDACVREVVRQFGNSRRTCDVCVFTITDDRISSAIEQAHRRGVLVRVITDDEKARDLGSDIDRLIRNGISCVTDSVPAHMHHKFALFDTERLLTGSFNWTRSATEYNEENLLVTGDPRLTAAFGEHFESLWRKYSQ